MYKLKGGLPYNTDCFSYWQGTIQASYAVMRQLLLEKRMVKEKGTPCEKVFLTPTFQGGGAWGQIMSKEVVDVISMVSPSGIVTHFDLVSKE